MSTDSPREKTLLTDEQFDKAIQQTIEALERAAEILGNCPAGWREREAAEQMRRLRQHLFDEITLRQSWQEQCAIWNERACRAESICAQSEIGAQTNAAGRNEDVDTGRAHSEVQDNLPRPAAPSNDKSQLLRTLDEIEDAIWSATGSALLAGEKAHPEDAGTIRSQLCRAGNLVAWVKGELNAARSATGTTDPVRIVGIITFDWIRRVARQESMKYLEGTESPEDVVRVVLDAVRELSSSDSWSNK